MPFTPAPATPRTNRWITATVLALLLILSAQILHAIHGQSLTWDEDDHIFAGYESWKTHDFGLNPEHPPLVKLLATSVILGESLQIPPNKGRFFKEEAYLDGRDFLWKKLCGEKGNHRRRWTLPGDLLNLLRRDFWS